MKYQELTFEIGFIDYELLSLRVGAPGVALWVPVIGGAVGIVKIDAPIPADERKCPMLVETAMIQLLTG